MSTPASPWPQTQADRVPSEDWLRGRFLTDLQASATATPHATVAEASVPLPLPWYDKYYATAAAC